MIPPLATLQTMPGGDVLFVLRDALLDEAERVRTLEEQLIGIGHIQKWDAGRASAHHAMVAAAEIVERLRQKGEESRAAKRKTDALVLLIADVARSALIIERTRIDTSGADDRAAPPQAAAEEEASDATIA